MKKELPQRKPLRLRQYDYSTPGAYFITFCTHDKKCTLSRVVGAIHESPETQLTEYGRIVDEVIAGMGTRFPATVDGYVVMPNHVHLILMIVDDEALRAIRESPLQGRSVISKTVGYIKMNASRAIRQRYGDAAVWQRGFHDHVIRDQRDYEKIARYVYENPARWQSDCFYTPAPSVK